MALPFDLPMDFGAVAGSLGATHVLARIDPGVWNIRYQLYVPKAWSIETDFPMRILEKGEPVPIGAFLEKQEADTAAITVLGCQVDIEVSLEDWVDHILAQQNLTAFGGRYVNTPNGRCWDAGVVEERVPDRIFSRVTAYAVAGTIYLVTSRCAEARWDALKETFVAAHFSFEVLDTPRRNVDRLEPLLEWQSQSEPRVHTGYPAAWRAFPVPTETAAIDAVDFKLIDAAGERLLGNVRLKLTSASKPHTSETLLESVVDMLCEHGYKVTVEQFARLERDHYLELMDGYEGTWAYPAKLEVEVEQEIRIAIRRVGPRFAVATAIGAPHRVEPILWMRTKRTLEVIVSNVTTPLIAGGTANVNRD